MVSCWLEFLLVWFGCYRIAHCKFHSVKGAQCDFCQIMLIFSITKTNTHTPTWPRPYFDIRPTSTYTTMETMIAETSEDDTSIFKQKISIYSRFANILHFNSSALFLLIGNKCVLGPCPTLWSEAFFKYCLEYLLKAGQVIWFKNIFCYAGLKSL